MANSPFPQGFTLPGGQVLGRALVGRDGCFWIHSVKTGGRAILAPTVDVALEEVDPDGLVPWKGCSFGAQSFRAFITDGILDTVDRLKRPNDVDQAVTFAVALSAATLPFGEAVYSEQLGRIFPFGIDPSQIDKAEILGRYLTGGVPVQASDLIALRRVLPKADPAELETIVTAAGLPIPQATGGRDRKSGTAPSSVPGGQGVANGRFDLPGRRELSEFFNEHVVDIVADEERYSALGIGFPGAIVLEGPTGCGKTFAVERLIEHLGWSSFHIDASSVASPYIHETSRKVAEVFSAAIKAAPSVIVIDEMDAFLANRDLGGHQHHVEEVAEFLRRIPEAGAKRVLVIGMTNKVDSIDPAILRRGRFDHVIHVDHAGPDEVAGLLDALLAKVPNDVNDVAEFSQRLVGRPLSDVSFVVREAGRLAARARKDRLGDEELAAALARCGSRNEDDERRIGF